MEYRELGRTGYKVSVISFGAWAIGGTWGPVEDSQSMAALHRALELGVNFFDTADVYGDGRSERLLARLRRESHQAFFVATKAGRRLPKQTPEGYSKENLYEWVGRSLKNLETETLDLLQLHCPPRDVYLSDRVFSILDEMKRQGMIRHYGISVETVEEALLGTQYPGVQSVQIIFNMFRLKPAEQFFPIAKARQVGILARVPLASGLLTGKLRPDSQFAPDDHRSFNRHGEAFDKGETFSGVEYETGLQAVEALKKITPPGMTLAQFALRWIAMFPEVTCAIPGAKNPQQAEENVRAGELPPIPSQTMEQVQAIYDRYIRAQVHPLW
ncbi:MAG: aldo/keto reductase [Thermaceae bacterium]|nr:aldo/keto reductase [Thermaceae bacterium]